MFPSRIQGAEYAQSLYVQCLAMSADEVVLTCPEYVQGFGHINNQEKLGLHDKTHPLTKPSHGDETKRRQENHSSNKGQTSNPHIFNIPLISINLDEIESKIHLRIRPPQSLETWERRQP